VRAYADGAEAGAQDVVLLAVKAHQVKHVLPAMQGLLGPETAVVTMSNGLPWWYFQRLRGAYENRILESVDPGGAIAAAIAAERVIGCVVYPAAELIEPGRVRLIEGDRFTLGEPDGHRSPRIDALSQALVRAGFKAPVTKDIRGEVWLKLWGTLCFNPVSALSHATLEGICRDPDGRASSRR
jgi:2-dehydropantoate 2-reductase